MMKAKHQRLIYALVSLCVLAVAATLVLRAMRNQIVYFYTPTELMAHASPQSVTPLQPNQRLRLGGLVESGSYQQTGAQHAFVVMDGTARVAVQFSGSLPALFREGQGIVAEGTFDAASQHFMATQVLAKHDENYMPPEIAKKLKAQGRWKPAAAEGAK